MAFSRNIMAVAAAALAVAGATVATAPSFAAADTTPSVSQKDMHKWVPVDERNYRNFVKRSNGTMTFLMVFAGERDEKREILDAVTSSVSDDYLVGGTTIERLGRHARGLDLSKTEPTVLVFKNGDPNCKPRYVGWHGVAAFDKWLDSEIFVDDDRR